MAKPILVANWKNRPSSLFEAKAVLGGLARNIRFYQKWAFFIAPPLPYFESVSLRTSSFAGLASQNIEILPAGVHTGAVSIDILKSFGVKVSIIGHSELRSQGETDELINRKIKLLLRSGISPLLCIGESTRDEAGEHFGFLRTQLERALAGLAKKGDVSRLIVAYEPVWAIGKSARITMEPDELSQALIFIKKVLSDILGRRTADRIPVLYGGSVEPDNARALIKTGVRGFLVGHASLNPKDLKKIAESILKQ